MADVAEARHTVLRICDRGAPVFGKLFSATLAPESVIVRDPSVCGGQPLRHWQTHIRDGLGRADDIEVWKRAKNDGYCIVSKDSDYYNLSVLYGQPPKVIWLRLGNCTTREIFDCLRIYQATIKEFGADAGESVLLIP